MKKYILILITCSILPLVSLGVNPPETTNTKPVFSKLLENEGIDTYKIPAFLIRYALSFSEDAQEVKPLFKDANFVKIAICDNCEKDYNLIYCRICKNLDLSMYQNLVDIVDAKSKVTIKALFYKEFIREIVVLIHDEDNLIALSMTGKIDPHNIADAVAKLNKSKTDKF